jgi:hypothetical protein
MPSILVTFTTCQPRYRNAPRTIKAAKYKIAGENIVMIQGGTLSGATLARRRSPAVRGRECHALRSSSRRKKKTAGQSLRNTFVGVSVRAGFSLLCP